MPQLSISTDQCSHSHFYMYLGVAVTIDNGGMLRGDPQPLYAGRLSLISLQLLNPLPCIMYVVSGTAVQPNGYLWPHNQFWSKGDHSNIFFRVPLLI